MHVCVSLNMCVCVLLLLLLLSTAYEKVVTSSIGNIEIPIQKRPTKWFIYLAACSSVGGGLYVCVLV